jgi:diacylglycerol kinase family enzyme
MKENIISGRENICCIINPGAAHKKWLKKRKLREYLRKELPGEVYDILGSKEDTVELARKLSRRNKMIVALGGDGTIADILQGVMEAKKDNEILFGIVPLGSGNAFRKSLKIPKNTSKAVKILHECEPLEIDLFRIEGRTAGFASIGITADVTGEKLQHPVQGLWGHLLAARKMLARKPEEREVELFDGIDDDGRPFAHKKLNVRFLDCVVGKTHYFGYSFKVAPLADLQDGYIDITFLNISGLKYIMIFPLIYLGYFQRTQKHFKAKKMIIRGQGLHIQYNGEYLGVKDSAEVEVLPRAIKIISPLGCRS